MKRKIVADVFITLIEDSELRYSKSEWDLMGPSVIKMRRSRTSKSREESERDDLVIEHQEILRRVRNSMDAVKSMTKPVDNDFDNETQNNLSSVIILLKRALKLNPADTITYVLLSQAYLALERYDETLATIDRALNLMHSKDSKVEYTPNGNVVWLNCIKIHALISKGELLEALKTAKGLAEIAYDNPDALRHLALAYFRLAESVSKNNKKNDAIHHYLFAIHSADLALTYATRDIYSRRREHIYEDANFLKRKAFRALRILEQIGN